MQASPALPKPENKQYYPALDGLRALAVLLVFASHYVDLPPALSWGFTGVDIFFVLSGFLITGILFDSQDRTDRYRVFYARRTLRIFPLYYAVLLLPVVLYPVFRWQLHPAQWTWPVYVGNYARFLWQGDVVNNTSVFEDLRSQRFPSFTWQIPHLWSLCVEEQFYLLWPFAVFTLRRRERLRNICLLLVVLVPLLRVLALHTFSAGTIGLGLLYRTLPLRADSLLLGGAAALALRGAEREWVLRLARPLLIAVAAAAVLLEAASWLRLGHWIDPEAMKLHSAWGYTLLAVGAACVILLAVQPGTTVYRACMRPALRWLGVRSYGVYVYHLLLGQVWVLISIRLCLGHRGVAHLLLPLVALAGTLLVSWASFRYFESPLLRLKARFA